MALTSPHPDRHSAQSPGGGTRDSMVVDAIALNLGEDSAMNLFAAAWRKLEASALLPAPMNIEAVQASLFRHLAPADGSVDIVATLGEDGSLRSVGAFERQGLGSARPLPISVSWMADLPLAGTPLIDQRDPADALARLIAGVTRLQRSHAVLFRMVPNDGSFLTVAQRAALRLAVAPPILLDPFERAALDIGPSFEHWFNENFSRKRRKEYRRLAARLAEHGRVETVVKNRSEPLTSWIESFLALESRGWKGQRGTAIACSRDSARFLAEALDGLEQRGALTFWKLAVDGRPIAMLFALLTGGTAFLGKIAYDEAFARFSPGVLLIFEATRTLLGRGDIKRVDSCAAPNHPMIDNIWRGRAPFADFLISAPRTPAAMFHAVVAGERLRRPLRATAKSLYHAMLKGRRYVSC